MGSVRLGKTGLSVSRVGLGGIPIQRLSEPEAVRVVQRCLELGVTLLDTAHGYGTSEERIGKALGAIDVSGAGSVRRQDVIIATKTPARDRATAEKHLALSLQRLNTDYVDIWQLHNVSTPQAYEQVLGENGALEAAYEALRTGVVRHVGITSHSMEVGLQAVAAGYFETIQFPFNFVTCEPADELLPLAQAHDVGFIAMKPFAGGMLDDANLAMKYLLQFDGVVPDPGIESVEEIEEIVAIVTGPLELTGEELHALERIRSEVGTRFCRRCGYCEPCPQGVRVSMIMNLPSFWKRFPPERFSGGWLAEAVASAEACVHCGECEEKCPYQLPIQEMLEENVDFFERVAAEMGV